MGEQQGLLNVASSHPSLNTTVVIKLSWYFQIKWGKCLSKKYRMLTRTMNPPQVRFAIWKMHRKLSRIGLFISMQKGKTLFHIFFHKL